MLPGLIPGSRLLPKGVFPHRFDERQMRTRSPIIGDLRAKGEEILIFALWLQIFADYLDILLQPCPLIDAIHTVSCLPDKPMSNR
jgi:hypothetical protein